MQVILLQNVEKIGKRYEIKKVADGYARNFLIPKGLAKPATEAAVKWAELQREIEAKKSEEDLKEAQQTASKLDGFELNMQVKVGEEGQLFESITAQKISEGLKEAGFDVKKSQIVLSDPIKEAGEFPVKIAFAHNLEVEIRVIITEEK